MKGVPLRIEIGEREVKENKVTVATRTGKKKEPLPVADLNKINDLLDSVSEELMSRSNNILKDALEGKVLGDIEDAVRTPILCYDEACARKMEEKLSLFMMGHIMNMGKEGKCEVCGKDGRTSLFSRPY
jgi:prolyl-tRNA synthetase